MLELCNVSKSYKNEEVLKKISLKFPSKGLFCILGKSGSGKTTLLNLMGGIDHPTEGKIYFNKEDISKIKKEIINILDDYLRLDEETNTKVLAVPDVYFIKNGKILTHHIGTVDSYKNPYLGMNKKQKEELKKIYNEGIEAINNE